MLGIMYMGYSFLFKFEHIAVECDNNRIEDPNSPGTSCFEDPNNSGSCCPDQSNLILNCLGFGKNKSAPIQIPKSNFSFVSLAP